MSDNSDPVIVPLSPIRKATRFLRCLARPSVARKLGSLATEGYLFSTGWVRSIRDGAIVDEQGAPLPWATYPFIDFIRPRNQPAWRVFEYGAGASTLFFAGRVAGVTSVEHDESFAAGLRGRLPVNARLLVQPEGSPAYADAVAQCDPQPDLVIVDGVDRVACVRASLPVMGASAVLVLDDAERPEYHPATALMKSQGFRVVEFWGLAPGVVGRKCTAVFYRSDNVLGL